MPKYRVGVYVRCYLYGDVEVEAESMEKAQAIALLDHDAIRWDLAALDYENKDVSVSEDDCEEVPA